MKKWIAFCSLAICSASVCAGIFSGIVELFESGSATAKAAKVAGAAKVGGAGEAAQTAQNAAKAAEAEKSNQLLLPSKDVMYSFPPGKSSAQIEPTALISSNLAAYKKLEGAAKGGDTDAMLKMARMLRSKLVIDPSIPHFDFWTAQAAAKGVAVAISDLRRDCLDKALRNSDQKFDAECRKY